MATLSDQPPHNFDSLRRDQRDRWIAGEQIAAREYFLKYSKLFQDADVALDFLYGEICLAEELGLGVTVEKYQNLYPQFATELASLLEVHQALGSDSFHEAISSLSESMRQVSALACPNCRNSISISDNGGDQTIVCKACGISFHLASDWKLPIPRPQPKRLGRYELLDTVGRGGFGSVYRSLDTQLQRVVAVKIPRSSQFATQDDEDRFVREAKNVAQLDHPCIVRVFDVGREDDIPYIVSEFVEGKTLAEELKNRRFSFRDAATLVIHVGEALEHAHQNGIVHRDMKPSNIMLDAAGMPRVLDFGMAKRDAADLTLTLDGTVLGTPAYMSPEQASGGGHTIDGSSDQYSLGVILYQLLTGKLPFEGNIRELLKQVQYEDPRPPRRLNDRIPIDLETICLKTLAKEPARRYPSVQSLVDDLKRYVAGKPIQARPVGGTERLWRLCRRNPMVSLLSITAVVSLLSGTIVSSILAVQAQRSAAEARLQSGLLRQSIYGKNMNLLQHAWVAGQVPQMRDMLEATEPADRGWEWHYWTGRLSEDLRTLDIQAGEVRSVAAAPSGRFVAAATAQGKVVIWNILSNKITTNLSAHQGAATCVIFSPDEAWLATGGEDRAIHLWELSSEDGFVAPRPVRSLAGHTGAVRAMAISRDGKQIASIGDDQPVRFWNPATGLTTLNLWRRSRGAVDLAFSPNGKQLALATDNQIAELYDIASVTKISEFKGHQGPIQRIAFSPLGDRIATAGRDQTVRVWDLSGNSLRTLRGHSSAVLSIAFSPDGQRLATGSQDLSVRLWDVTNGLELRKIQGHFDSITCLAFLSEGRLVATGCADGQVKLWDVDLPTQQRAQPMHVDLIESVAFNPDGNTLASASNDGSVRIWQVETELERYILQREANACLDLAFSPDSQRLAVLGDDATIRLWNVGQMSVIRTISLPTPDAISLAFAPDNRHLAVAINNSAWLMDDEGQRQIEFSGHTDRVSDIAFSHDGQLLATCSSDRTAKLWSLPSGALVRTLDPHSEPLTGIAFSRDGQLLLTTAGRSAQLWSVADGQRLRAFNGHTGTVRGLAFSPDASRIVTTSDDRTAKLWSTQSGDELLSIQCSDLASVCFSPDGQRLAINAAAGQVQWLDIHLPTSDEKMGQCLARPIVQQHPLRQDALKAIQAQTDWPEPLLKSAQEFANWATNLPDDGPGQVLNLMTIESPERLVAAERLVTALRRVDDQSIDIRTLQAAVLWRSGKATEAIKLLPEPDDIHHPSAASIYLLVQHTLGIEGPADAEPISPDPRLVNLIRSQSPSENRLSAAYQNFFNTALTGILLAGQQAYDQRNFRDASRHLDFFTLFQSADQIDPTLLAEHLAVSGKWSQASQVMLASKFDDYDWVNQANTALLACAAEDMDSYRQACRKLLPTYMDTVDASAATVVGVACMLEENSLEDSSVLLRFAERTLRLPGAAPAMQVILGVAQYRNQQIESARDTLNQVSRTLDLLAPFAGARQIELDMLRLCCLNFLAAIHHDLGEAERSSQAIKRAQELVARLTNAVPPADGRLSPWNAACAAEIARRQLAQLESAIASEQP